MDMPALIVYIIGWDEAMVRWSWHRGYFMVQDTLGRLHCKGRPKDGLQTDGNTKALCLSIYKTCTDRKAFTTAQDPHRTMALSILCLVLSFYFVFLSSALPNPALSTRQTLATETWHIPRLNMHMMTSGTGIPGNPPWPDESKFNSTIDFDVLIPAAAGSQKWNCRGAMVNGTIIQGLAECLRGGEGVEGGLMFGMQKYDAPGERRAELSFELWLSRTGYACLRLLLHLRFHAFIDINQH